jgi:DNA-binding transcriptional ArsR family regulator
MINMAVNPADGVFRALASLPRRQMLSFLSQTALSTAELAGRFGMSPPAVSRHLAVLQRAGLVSSEREGQRVLYRLDRDALLGALARLADEVDGPLRRRTPPREAI